MRFRTISFAFLNTAVQQKHVTISQKICQLTWNGGVEMSLRKPGRYKLVKKTCIDLLSRFSFSSLFHQILKERENPNLKNLHSTLTTSLLLKWWTLWQEHTVLPTSGGNVYRFHGSVLPLSDHFIVVHVTNAWRVLKFFDRISLFHHRETHHECQDVWSFRKSWELERRFMSKRGSLNVKFISCNSVPRRWDLWLCLAW